MLDPKPFVERAAAQAESEVLAWARARQRLPGAAIATPGLLCAIAEGLVFVVDDVVGPGEVTLLERSAIERAVVEHGALDAVLRLETADGPVVYEDLRPEELRALEPHGLVPHQADDGVGAPLGTPELGVPSPIAIGASYPSAVGLGPTGDTAASAAPQPLEPRQAHPSLLESSPEREPGLFTSHPSWIGGATTISGGEPWIPGSRGLDSNAPVAGGSIGEAIAREAYRARLLGVLADRVEHARAQRQRLVDRLASNAAAKAADEAVAGEAALAAHLSEAQEQVRQRAIQVARERVAAMADGPDVRVEVAPRKRKKKRPAVEPPSEPARLESESDDAARTDSPPPTEDDGSSESSAPAPERPTWASGPIVWLCVLAGALPGLWIHPAVSLLGAIAAFLLASRLASRRGRNPP